MNIIKPYIELIFSILLMCFFGNQAFFIMLICSVDMSGFVLFKQFLGILEINLAFFTICYAGKLLDDIQEMISLQVYDIPWYNLTPQQRKTVYIFLCQAQQEVTFYGFTIYPMNVPIALKLGNMAFSIYNILRTVLNE